MNSELQTWLALIGPAVVLLIAIVGAVRKLLTRLDEKIDTQTAELKKNVSDKITSLDDKLDRQTDELKELVQVRHIENVQRLTRVETLLGNLTWWEGRPH